MDIHLLDVGQVKFGDCILIKRGQRKILIDGGHPGDTARIRDQLKEILGQDPPFQIDLLIVTHCHNDHIGCLPTLIGNGNLEIDRAVVADEKFGFGRDADDDSPIDAMPLSDAQRALIVALQEEDHSDLPPDELEQFLQDAATLEDKYIAMLEDLGTKVVRYGRDPDAKLAQVEADFAGFGLKFLGPTLDHLLTCANALSEDSDAIGRALVDNPVDDAAEDLAAAYRRWVKRMPGPADDPEFAADQGGSGAAKNDQSIVIKVKADGWSALLAGDMQFAKAQVSGLNPEMQALRQKVKAAGPYDFVKLSHHSSDNAVDAAVMSDYPGTRLFGHTGGLKDPTHPDPDVLELLEGMAGQLTFARTDHNGRIKVSKVGSKVKMTPSRGQLNDFAPNPANDTGGRAIVREGGGAGGRVEASTATRAQSDGVVEVITRVPHTDTRVTVTIDIDPQKKKVTGREVSTRKTDGPPGLSGLRVGGASGRPMGKLLFVTNRRRLEANIGHEEATAVLSAVRGTPNVELLELPDAADSAEAAAAVVRPRLGPGLAGVVLLGGYDVVPANRLDVLDAPLRQAVADAGFEGEDADDFFVWSDELYGDYDGDWMPELPVTRIPDGRRADVVIGALGAGRFAHGGRFGVHNINRPFALEIFPLVPGAAESTLEVSEEFAPEDVASGVAAGAVYYMLHGSARDGTRFWGEKKASGNAVEAVAVENVPESASGTVVFTGCCWGALTMSPPAARIRAGAPLRPRGPEASMAVAYLRAGALGFVGCTGSHYSPLRAPYNFFGRPMHDSFWRAIGAGKGPAEALFMAKKEFALGMPHGREDPFSRAVELKILRQFTCLGLGW